MNQIGNSKLTDVKLVAEGFENRLHSGERIEHFGTLWKIH